MIVATRASRIESQDDSFNRHSCRSPLEVFLPIARDDPAESAFEHVRFRIPPGPSGMQTHAQNALARALDAFASLQGFYTVRVELYDENNKLLQVKPRRFMVY